MTGFYMKCNSGLKPVKMSKAEIVWFFKNDNGLITQRNHLQVWVWWKWWKSFKIMKNAFYFTLRALFVLRILKFLSWLFGHFEKTTRLERPSNFKIHNVTTWLANNWIHILSNISISKGNQAIKFGQLIEYNMKNIFVEKWYTKCAGEISRPLSKKSKLSISLDQ